ncbi:hypothetical protein IP91_00901 [Pseudoduganella lurida]|uniref:Uncharacterized protein n=1 Tax=Pseudoduganella lurida TaxID=1036180 RepID=A0A562RLA2_9BURK|nr:hypothetical protein [Pseudoduganella lurida]TWI69828.1 hypothetical protein IP91_00901 [Pseudoduganella lurida]
MRRLFVAFLILLLPFTAFADVYPSPSLPAAVSIDSGNTHAGTSSAPACDTECDDEVGEPPSADPPETVYPAPTSIIPPAAVTTAFAHAPLRFPNPSYPPLKPPPAP